MGVPLPDLTHNWSSLCVKDVLQPCHNASTFLHQPNFSTFYPVANIVSMVNLNKECPSSLLQALTSAHPDREILLQSYYEEKDFVEIIGTFTKLSLGEYCALRENSAPRAIHTMCILTSNNDENLLPLRATS